MCLAVGDRDAIVDGLIGEERVNLIQARSTPFFLQPLKSQSVYSKNISEENKKKLSK